MAILNQRVVFLNAQQHQAKLIMLYMELLLMVSSAMKYAAYRNMHLQEHVNV